MSKAKAKRVNFTSFLDLKAEISKQEEEFAQNKATGKVNYVVGGVRRPDKKPTVWARQNKGLESRVARDVELEAISKPTLESARSVLEKKARIYEKLRKGKTGGLSDQQYDALLVDFDSKHVSEFFQADSEDEDESSTVPRPPQNDEDDPIVEYEDEFGRIRTARRSEVPRELAPASGGENSDDDEDIIIRNPVNHFPVYEPSAERVAQIAAEHAEENNPLNIHYDASQEVRAKGAGFYQFSGDEEMRRAQMEELKMAREETEKTRQETGAVNIRPGEVEGMLDETGKEDAVGVRSRAMEKRKRELEERRKMIDAKRRKVKGDSEQMSNSASTSEPKPSTSSGPTAAGKIADTPSAPVDPLATLEAKSTPERMKRNRKTIIPPANEADAFLAQLEQDFLASRKNK